MNAMQKLRTMRIRVGETQAEFAARFGVAQSTINHWEKNGPPKNGAAVIAIKRVLADIERELS